VTEDAAEFGDTAPEEFPAGPGDAPVAGEDQTLETGAAQAEHRYVEDDPNEGVPIEAATHEDSQ